MLSDTGKSSSFDWANWGLSGGGSRGGSGGGFEAQTVLRASQRRLLEALTLDPTNQHARDSLRSLREVAGSLGVVLPDA